ncbi:cbb3-type cytochrome c oxidase subunit I [Empedobacter brevis]|uniref:cbb3-type cytochrome c oxidase subunit I n=1 Tax=Empedobacter brevis TaxID=247 RepID=UPI0028986B3F|nr:cbb3-type cytochrome c oxidase subunit I [Empedobacter brevis]
MNTKHFFTGLFLLMSGAASAQDMLPLDFSFHGGQTLTLVFIAVLSVFILVLVILNATIGDLLETYRKIKINPAGRFQRYLRKMNGSQITKLLQSRNKRSAKITVIVFVLLHLAFQHKVTAQDFSKPDGDSVWAESGVVITIVLIAIPVLIALLIAVIQVNRVVAGQKHKLRKKEAEDFSEYLDTLSDDELEALEQRKTTLEYALTDNELSGTQPPEDRRGLLQHYEMDTLPVVAIKKKAQSRPNIYPELAKIVLWYLGTATFWLLFGTTVGEYLGIKFIAPDADHTSWLSFGRLRPVHTNAVFWGWASLGMLGLGYYIVPRVSNVPLASAKWAWYSLGLINAAVLLGSASLMAGLNNGGGEYREYIWPIMLLFALGLTFTLRNFIKTIALRKTEEIYISNWYIVAAIIFISVVALVGYLPFWQNGLGETIVQGYYMHQAVGMWFMLFTLGIVYYFLPQQLNKPIYSYSLGILAFWTQILFYTLIGTHHFVFSAIPWWLQTVAIVASAGMIIPVIAGTTNFLMTFKGAWYKLRDSYTLPFFLVGIVFYFTGSMQGTAEAFRFTNLLWHFTDFTVAHSHLTMYGIISFFLWAGIYAVIPRLTGKEAPQITIGIHFWLALIGLMFYTVPLMYGGTLRGLAWMEVQPFIDTVAMMMPYWLWRAIGGTLMWLSHLFFAYNLYKMTNRKAVHHDIAEMALQKLEERTVTKPADQPNT